MPQISVVARSSLTAAVLGAGVAWMGCEALKRRALRTPMVIACGALAFFAEFGWQTRTISSQLVNGAAKEITKVRDQHWLELNPIDYA